MTGSVANLHALLPVTFRLPAQPDVALEFVVDTGFTGALTLPVAAVAVLTLPLLHRIPADLADGSSINVAVHTALVLWHGEERLVRVLATGLRPLLGTELLEGCDLVVRFAEGGRVSVDAF